MSTAPRIVGLVLWLGAALGAPARGEPLHYRIPFCINRLELLAEHIRRIPIPHGCELVGCCAGCSADDASIDWKISASGPALLSVTLGFEGLADDATLVLEGDGSVSRARATVGPGGATLRGLRGRGDRVPMASLAVRFDEPKLRARAAAGGPSPPGNQDRIEIAIEQWLGSALVNERRLVLIVHPCSLPAPGPCMDSVEQIDNRENDVSVLLLDGRRGGSCVDDEVHRGEATVEVGNFGTPGACVSSEVSIFSRDDAMAMRAPETTWTDACGDRATVKLEPRLALPVTVWLARPAWLESASQTESAAKLDLANADLVFDQNKTGIRFEPEFQDVSDSLRAKLVTCASAGALPPSLHDPQRLNVYYSASPTTGESCDEDRNTIIVGTFANLATLAHEFGHALSLVGGNDQGGHVNQLPDFAKDNVMWGGGSPTRSHLALGQAFRFNVDSRSVLNTNGVRTDPTTRLCPALGPASAECPVLHLDWVRP